MLPTYLGRLTERTMYMWSIAVDWISPLQRAVCSFRSLTNMTRHNHTSWLCLKKNGWGWLYFSYCTHIVLVLYNIPSSKSMLIKCIFILMVKLICSSRIVNWQGKQMVENKTNKMDLKNVLLMKSDTSGLYICLRYDPNVLLMWYFVYCFISMGFTFSLFAISFWKEKYLEKMMKVRKYLYFMQKP